ncbi:MAG TPA: hypothetical protein VMU19_08135, partial [Bryobacteraceae bacterium]|nr:hypothetical protein [Bryobacteraceae bacterium]
MASLGKRRARLGMILAAVACAGSASAQTRNLPERTWSQVRALLSEKASRNAAQAKVDSHLVHAAAILRHQPVSPDFPAPPGELEAVRPDSRNFVEVDIRATVTSDLLSFIRSLGGEVSTSLPEYRALRARLPLLSVERVAERAEVLQIRPAAQALVNAAGPDAIGDIAHQANAARANFNLDGAGITVGVISNGVTSLASEQSKGNLPANVTVLPGQAGAGDEGTA